MKATSSKIALTVLDQIAWILVVVFYVAFAVIMPHALLKITTLTFMLYAAAPLGFLVLAETLVLITGNMDLSIDNNAGFVAMLSGVIIMTTPGIPWYLAILLPPLFGMAVGAFNGFIVGYMRMNPFLVTLGTTEILAGARLLLYPGTIPGSVIPAGYMMFGGDPLVAIATFLVILVCFWFFLKYTRVGNHLYAVGGSSEAAMMMGINLKRSYLLVFMLSGMLAGIAGLFFTGFVNSVSRTLADWTLFPAFSGAVIGGVAMQGGRGSPINAFAGTVFIGIVEGGLTMFAMPTETRVMVYGVLVIAAIFINKTRDIARDRILTTST
jgi:ribose/xylose/arabinose/galactoside ABC-type transport system permease subunit